MGPNRNAADQWIQNQGVARKMCGERVKFGCEARTGAPRDEREGTSMHLWRTGEAEMRLCKGEIRNVAICAKRTTCAGTWVVDPNLRSVEKQSKDAHISGSCRDHLWMRKHFLTAKLKKGQRTRNLVDTIFK